MSGEKELEDYINNYSIVKHVLCLKYKVNYRDIDYISEFSSGCWVFLYSTLVNEKIRIYIIDLPKMPKDLWENESILLDKLIHAYKLRNLQCTR